MLHWTPLYCCNSLTSSSTQTQASPGHSCTPASTVTVHRGANQAPKGTSSQLLIQTSNCLATSSLPKRNQYHYQPCCQSVSSVTRPQEAAICPCPAQPLQERFTAKLHVNLAVRLQWRHISKELHSRSSLEALVGCQMGRPCRSVYVVMGYSLLGGGTPPLGQVELVRCPSVLP